MGNVIAMNVEDRSELHDDGSIEVGFEVSFCLETGTVISSIVRCSAYDSVLHHLVEYSEGKYMQESVF
jgi:hypothetical protein